MLNLKKFVIYLLIGILALSCSKDDEKNTNSGTMTYLGKEFKLSEARIISQEHQGDIYRYTVALYASDVVWVHGTFSKGHFLTFDLDCANSDGVSAGTYYENLSDNFVSMKTNSSNYYEINSEYPYSSDAILHPESIVIKITGNLCEISYMGDDGVDRPFNASYKGSLKKIF